jgi:hypothetical protein
MPTPESAILWLQYYMALFDLNKGDAIPGLHSQPNLMA